MYLKLSHSDSEDGIIDQAARILKDKLYESSGGTMVIDIYPNDTLGTIDDSTFTGDNMVELRMGASSATLMRVISWLPVLEPDFELTMMNRALAADGELRAYLEENSLEKGARLLAVFPSTYRLMTSNKRCRNINDIQGLKMRVFTEGLEAELWELLGADSIPYPISQTYLALQQGAVDSEENAFATISSYRLFEQQKYLIHTNHKVYTDGLYIKEEVFESLTQDQQSMLMEAVDGLMETYPETMNLYLERMESMMSSLGVKHIYWEEPDRQAMMDVWRDHLLEFLYDKYGEEMVDQARSICHE